MTKDDIAELIFEGLRLCNEARPDSEQIPVGADTVLFGPDGNLDSMALVGLLLDIEDALLERGIEVALSDESAMSEARSPFRDVHSLADYIAKQLPEA